MKQIADLVILRVPFVGIWCLFEPFLILGNGEEIDPLFSSCDLRRLISHSKSNDTTHSDNWSHKLDQEVRNLQ